MNRWWHVCFVVVCACLAYLVSPAGADQRLVIPVDRELDALQHTLLVEEGINRVLTAPSRYYDTDILYPDHNQFRTTEPFLGFVLIGLPFATILQLDHVRVYEVIRWILVFAGLLYARALLGALGARPALACAGAMLCVLQPVLVTGFERLQVLSIPLIAGVLYHAYALWSGEARVRMHQAGLCVMAVLYPLCGAYNITMAAFAVICVAPLLIRVVTTSAARLRLGPLIAPLVVAAALNVCLLWPWLFDRADLAAYAGDAFLAIKHWNEALAPRWLVWVTAAPGAYQAGVYVGLLAFLIWQVRTTLPSSTEAWHGLAARVLLGLGLVSIVASFGPSMPANTNPLATDALRRMLDVVPPLKSIREFERFWPFGMTLLILGALGVVASARHRWMPSGSLVLALAIAAVSFWPLATRTTALTRPVEAAPWFVALAAQAPGKGALYVHPLMTWNTPSCVLMPDAARQLQRPLVNGCLGVPPPWFVPAAEVLHRFPDPESIWLLRHWRVEGVVHLDNKQPVEESRVLRLVTQPPEGRVYALLDDGPPLAHPSRVDVAESQRLTRVPLTIVRVDDDGVHVEVPAGLWVWALEVEFSPEGLVVHPMPAELVVTADVTGAPRLNLAGAGHWMQSLAADALLARSPPVATIRFEAPHRGALRLSGGGRLSISRVVALGETSRD